MYRPSSRRPETAWARHLDQVRRDRDWSATQLFEYVREPLHLSPKSRSAFVDGLHKDPRPTYLPVLRDLFGEPAPEEAPTKEPGGVDLTGLVAALANALQAQAQALTDIRLALAQAARDAESERLATAALLGHLSDQLDELRELGGRRAGSFAPGSAH